MYPESRERKKNERVKKGLKGPNREEFIEKYIDGKLRGPGSDKLNGGKLFRLARTIDELNLWDETNAIEVAFSILKSRVKNQNIAVDYISSLLYDIEDLFIDSRKDNCHKKRFRSYLRSYYKTLPSAKDIFERFPTKNSKTMKVGKIPFQKLKIAILEKIIQGWSKYNNAYNNDAEACFVFLNEAYGECDGSYYFYQTTCQAIDNLFRQHLETGAHWCQHELDQWILYFKNRRNHDQNFWEIVDRENWTIENKKYAIKTHRDIFELLYKARTRQGGYELGSKELKLWHPYDMHNRTEEMNKHTSDILKNSATLDQITQKLKTLVNNHQPSNFITKVNDHDIKFEQGYTDKACIYLHIDPRRYYSDEAHNTTILSDLIKTINNKRDKLLQEAGLKLKIEIQKIMPHGSVCRG